MLGFFVSHQGIEANPDKIKAIEQIQAPKTVKDVRRLTGCVAALSRFISKSAERALPFFKILKKAGPMKWTPEAEAALQDLKRYLSSTPILVAPKPQEKLLFGLLMASRKLRHYFQAHEITVVTRFPLKRILENPEATGRIVEWALELSSFGLKFESTSTIQSWGLA